MENQYTKAALNKLSKTELSKLAGDCGITVPEGTSNNRIVDMIVEKGGPGIDVPYVSDTGVINSEQNHHPSNGGVNNATIDNNVGNKGNAAYAGGQPMDEGNSQKFSKEQLMKSNWYSHKRDILATLLADGEWYTYETVDRMVKEFAESKVK